MGSFAARTPTDAVEAGDGRHALTVLVPTYNRADRLPRALDSLLGQTRGDFEVLISDNASTDDTEAVCAEYLRRDPRLRYHRQPSNLGPIGNFNWLLGEVRTEFLLMLADDDWLDPEYVERCLEIIGADPSLSIITAATRYYDDGQVDAPHPDLILNTEMLESTGERRVLRFLSKSWTSSAFYGVIRTSAARNAVPLVNVMGADWLFVSALAFQGRVLTTATTHLNRERGGASVNFEQIARTMRLSKRAATFPIAAIIFHQFRDIAHASPAYSALSRGRRIGLAVGATAAIAREHWLHLLWEPIAPIAMRRPFVYAFGPLREWWRSRRFYG
jgi:glycosyltransferase involved in cell wall biosynthesis